MSKLPDRDYVGTQYRAWISSLSHERLLPTRRRTIAVFAVAYAITFAWRAFTTMPWPFLFGLFVTILLSVRTTNLLLVRLLRRDLRRSPTDRRLYAGLEPVVYAATMAVLVALGSAFVLAYLWLPGAPL